MRIVLVVSNVSNLDVIIKKGLQDRGFSLYNLTIPDKIFYIFISVNQTIKILKLLE